MPTCLDIVLKPETATMDATAQTRVQKWQVKFDSWAESWHALAASGIFGSPPVSKHVPILGETVSGTTTIARPNINNPSISDTVVLPTVFQVTHAEATRSPINPLWWDVSVTWTPFVPT